MTARQTVVLEREWWDAHAGPSECWGDDETWDEGQAGCVDALRCILDRRAGWAFDLGCGVGRLAVPILRKYPSLRVMGFDISPGMIRWARAVGQERFRPMVNDGRTIPVPAHEVRSELGGCPYYVCGWSVLLFQYLPFDAVVGYLHEARAVLQDRAPFRFQLAVGDVDDDAFLSYKHDVDAVLDACREARLAVVAVDEGLVRADWMWVTVERR